MPNFHPKVSGGSFETKNIHGEPIVNEQVWFIPDVSIDCFPPYEKGKSDTCWVKYLKGKRPSTKEEWQNCIGMSIQTML